MKIKVLILGIMILFLFSGKSYGLSGKEKKELDKQRIEIVNSLSDLLDQFYQKKKYYPLGGGKHNLPVCVYLSRNLNEVSGPIHYLQSTILDVDLLIEEIRAVLGVDTEIPLDTIDTDKNAGNYIIRYYSTGSGYLIVANLFKGYKYTNHVNFRIPQKHEYINKSKIKKLYFMPGFWNQYAVGNDSRLNSYIFTAKDVDRIKKMGFDSKKKQNKLLDAVTSKDIKRVKKILADGANINPIHESFNSRATPLIFAIDNQDVDMVKFLIDNGADVNGRGGYSDVPLIYAVPDKEYNAEIVKLLLEAGADVNLPNFFGVSPFIGACMIGDESLVRLYSKYSADIDMNYFGYDGKKFMKKDTPLIAAIRYGNTNVVKVLIELGCNINKKATDYGPTPLEFAREEKNQEIIDLF